MITQDKLIAELSRRGITLWPRTVTDWVTRKLLPDRKRRGKGPGGGRGPQYYWDGDDIFERVVVINTVLSATHNPDTVLFVLWFWGFDVSGTELRRVWVKRYRDVYKKFVKKTDPGETREDYFWNLAATLSNTPSTPDKLNADDFSILYTRYLIATFGLPERRNQGFDRGEVLPALN